MKEQFKQFMSDLASGNIRKSELKDFVNANGFFSQSTLNMVSRDEAQGILDKKWWDNTIQITDTIPEWESIFIYDGTISQQYWKWEMNRNGYKIDKNWRKFDEYMYNPAILLMHDMDKWVMV